MTKDHRGGAGVLHAKDVALFKRENYSERKREAPEIPPSFWPLPPLPAHTSPRES